MSSESLARRQRVRTSPETEIIETTEIFTETSGVLPVDKKAVIIRPKVKAWQRAREFPLPRKLLSIVSPSGRELMAVEG